MFSVWRGSTKGRARGRGRLATRGSQVDDSYIRDPKGTRGGKFGPSEQDEEDCEQEKLIQEWLKQQGSAAEFEYKHINRKGSARNTVVRAQVRLDQKIKDDTAGTFADLIAGCDGRDLECRLDGVPTEPKAAAEILDSSIDWFFDAIGVTEDTKQWAKNSLKSAESLRRLRSLMKDDEPWEISTISLESLRRWSNFRK